MKSMHADDPQRAKLAEATEIASAIATCEKDPMTKRMIIFASLQKTMEGFPVGLHSFFLIPFPFFFFFFSLLPLQMWWVCWGCLCERGVRLTGMSYLIFLFTYCPPSCLTWPQIYRRVSSTTTETFMILLIPRISLHHYSLAIPPQPTLTTPASISPLLLLTLPSTPTIILPPPTRRPFTAHSFCSPIHF